MLLSQLIKIKSYSGEEKKIKNFISKWFAKRGIKFINQDENLVVHIKGKAKDKALIFNSHMDTVSAGDESLWKHGPFKPTYEGKKLVGLGASDMKAGLASSMLFAEYIVKQGQPPIDLWFTYVVKEEVDGSGTEDFAKWFKSKGWVKKYNEIAAIFTEPGGLVEIEHGHRGNLFLEVESRGESGHASRPDKVKTLAVRKMIKFSDNLLSEAKKWKKKYGKGKFQPPTVGEMTSLWAGVEIKQKLDGKKDLFIGSTSINKFPAVCKATFDLRTTPEFHDKAFDKVKKIALKTGVKVKLAFPAAPAGYTNPNEKIIQVVKKIVNKPQLTVSQGSADLGFLTELGIKGIIFGPGEGNQAHMTNEYCYPEQVDKAVNIYKEILDNWAEE